MKPDWALIPEKFNYFTVNASGQKKVFIKRPVLDPLWHTWESDGEFKELESVNFHCFKYASSLQIRPLPIMNTIGFDKWKQELIDITKAELEEAGAMREFKINDAEAMKCYESGMTPFQTFRENFNF